MSKWTYQECEAHWHGRRLSNNYRSIANCGWNRGREYMEFNEIDGCYDLTLHSTVVVRVFKYKYVINCGGWWTQLTRKKIREWSGVQLNGSYSRTKYIENQFVWYGGKMVSVYYPRMEVDLDGMPLKPLLPTGRKLRKGATKEFTDLAKRVRNVLMPRALMGEFEQIDEQAVDGEEVHELMQLVDAKSGGLFPEFMSTEELAPLFAHRPWSIFGRRSRAYGYSDDGPHDRTGIQCLQANINAAKREWLKRCQPDQIYEIVEKGLE
jgi:hypothetical protein